MVRHTVRIWRRPVVPIRITWRPVRRFPWSSGRSPRRVLLRVVRLLVLVVALLLRASTLSKKGVSAHGEAYENLLLPAGGGVTADHVGPYDERSDRSGRDIKRTGIIVGSIGEKRKRN